MIDSEIIRLLKKNFRDGLSEAEIKYLIELARIRHFRPIEEYQCKKCGKTFRGKYFDCVMKMYEHKKVCR